MKLTVKSIAFIVLLFIAAVATAYYLAERKRTKVVFVDNIRLFNEFSLKKELEVKLNGIKKVREATLDSMQLYLEMKGKQIDETKKIDNTVIQDFEMVKQQFRLKMKQTDEDNAALTKQYDEQIWKQLNEYVKKYAVENSYDFVLGSSGNGNLMHAGETFDVTTAVVEFVNAAYKGK
jgi:outer membrane protein